MISLTSNVADRDSELDAHAAQLAAQLPPFTPEEAAVVGRTLASIERDRIDRQDELTERAA